MKAFKKVLALILTLSMLMAASVNVFAQSETNDTEYLYDIRIVYADSLEDAQNKLADSEFRDYKLFEYNLNEGTEALYGIFGEEPHVYIAYKTTKDVELAITDIAVMDMNGGYNEGNLQAMLKKSMEEYEGFAKQYIKAFNYFVKALENGSALSDAAYRQLNLYKDPDSGERLGDLLLSDISSETLATILLQGNINVLDNMRALLAMGVSYNESGKSYLETVEITAAQMTADKTVFEDQNWYELSLKVSGTFSVIRGMINNYNTVRDTLNYEDEGMTEKEIEYLEIASIAERLENTKYLGDKSLADFICTYQETEDSYLTVYPLIAAMNDGQRAMSELYQFYNVLRYSSTDLAAEAMDEQITALENDCGKDGVSIYVGVDRSLYSGTFAVTTAADRAAASTGRNVASEVFASTNNFISYAVSGFAFIGNAGFLAYNLHALKAAATAATEAANRVAEIASNAFTEAFNNMDISVALSSAEYAITYKPAEILTGLAERFDIAIDPSSSLMTQATTVYNNLKGVASHKLGVSEFNEAYQQAIDISNKAADAAREAHQTSGASISLGATWAIFGGVSLAITAVNIGIWVYNYFNPELTDIPIAIVDLKENDTGDRYIYYEAVKDIDGNAADTNALEGEGWNALYITRSYEAGNALTADIDISYDNNIAGKDQISVHKFGETIGFNLNSHAFGDDKQIYLSVTASGDEKEGASEVPDIVGSLVTTGTYLLAGGVGIFAGAGIMYFVQKGRKKEEA